MTAVLEAIHPGYIVGVLAVLIVSQLLYALWPYRRRRYLVTLVTTTIGFVLGQLWAIAGLPALQLGDVNLLPALVFAVLAQPAVDAAWTRLRPDPPAPGTPDALSAPGRGPRGS